MPTGVYAELRNASNRRFVLVEEQTRAKNRLQKWIAVYFPEYKGIYTHIDAKGGLMVLKQAPTPEETVEKNYSATRQRSSINYIADRFY